MLSKSAELARHQTRATLARPTSPKTTDPLPDPLPALVLLRPMDLLPDPRPVLVPLRPMDLLPDPRPDPLPDPLPDPRSAVALQKR